MKSQMKTKFTVFTFITAILSSVLFLVSCSTDDTVGVKSNSSSSARDDMSNMNGVASAMPAYYDGKLFKILFKELPSDAEASLIAHNNSINTIYQSDPGLP